MLLTQAEYKKISPSIRRDPRPDYDGDVKIEIMASVGDFKLVFDKHNPDEVEQAKKTFNDLRAKGYLAFKAKKDGSAGEQLTAFDPKVERMILQPQMAGG